ncbi:adenylate/guanylate cyclase domain-containing protein [filamentous cyanobacterium LEGE 11480]|uniref:Adenylate/guanylate cyclase domain-containing protein n=1 Tax=Romeriopsis navalis LEGE 11480 TaxID=2777977 RepID=A0A928Z755_9CYAN|nr:adenylate/guanylate cyclase domain-containing protein [Romeriopsis navalis]MBE9033348.1 adenylate/guanylate cyclase domain-containing protein [Romeriopsis navalis LEGE 11480]
MTESNAAQLPESAVAPVARSMQRAIDQVIDQEALKNERKLAYVRVVVLLISSILDVLIFCFPQALLNEASVPPTIALISLSAFGISAALLWALRQRSTWRWLPQLQIAIPLFDSILIALFITNIWHVLGQSKPEIITNIAALCCLLAVSGGVRIRRRASGATTILALSNFTYAAALFGLNSAISAFVLFTILSIGLMGILTSGIVRRQSKNEAGRRLMQQFLPVNVVDAAFETPMELLERPRSFDVTIMVTDLRGFTHYSENLEPAAVMEFLNQLQGLLSQIVVQHGGWVDKFMGDGMLAVFGAPQPLDNHAEKALAAAQTMLLEVAQLSTLPVGIGLHSGSVVAGCLGADGHLEFTVIGDTVNVASRIEALTKQVGVSLLVSQITQQRLPLSAPPLQSVGDMPIRGRDAPIELFTLPN